MARLKFSISIENFNPGGRSWIFSIFGPLGSWKPPIRPRYFTWRTFRIFFIFFASGEGKGESGAAGRGGVRYLLKIPEGGGVLQKGRRGREGVCGEFGIFGGGWLNIFFRGRNVHQVYNYSNSGASFRRGDFAPREPEFGVEFCICMWCEFLSPEFWAAQRVKCFGHMFSNKEPHLKFTLKKVTAQNSYQKITGHRESGRAKRTETRWQAGPKNADFRRFASSPGTSSTWRAQTMIWGGVFNAQRARTICLSY